MHPRNNFIAIKPHLLAAHFLDQSSAKGLRVVGNLAEYRLKVYRYNRIRNGITMALTFDFAPAWYRLLPAENIIRGTH